jgi:hypothetical protein
VLPGADAPRPYVAALPGVQAAEERASEDGAACLDVRGAGDLREDLGRLARERGWVVRELSWRRPTLETLFARIAFGLEQGAAPRAPGGERAGAEEPS